MTGPDLSQPEQRAQLIAQAKEAVRRYADNLPLWNFVEGQIVSERDSYRRLARLLAGGLVGTIILAPTLAVLLSYALVVAQKPTYYVVPVDVHTGKILDTAHRVHPGLPPVTPTVIEAALRELTVAILDISPLPDEMQANRLLIANYCSPQAIEAIQRFNNETGLQQAIDEHLASYPHVITITQSPANPAIWSVLVQRPVEGQLQTFTVTYDVTVTPAAQNAADPYGIYITAVKFAAS
jgi:hypothetical protein